MIMSVRPPQRPAPATTVSGLSDAQHSSFERIEHAARLAAGSSRPGATSGSGLKAVAALFLAWRERQFAARVCRDLLRLHEKMVTRHPGQQGLSLYRLIVADRNGGSIPVADAILDRASQSFAEWPSRRALNFRDVVHCLVVLEFIAANRDARWIHADLKQFVGNAIPHGL